MFKCMLTILSLVLLTTTTAVAEPGAVYDATGKRFGTVIAQQALPWLNPWGAIVVASHNGVGYQVRMGRMSITGSEWLYYPSDNCTGNPVYPIHKNYRWDLLVHPSGIDLQGNIWIMRRTTMRQESIRSFVYTGGGYHGLDPASCESLDSAEWDNDGWVSPMTKVGKIKTLFPPPYSVR